MKIASKIIIDLDAVGKNLCFLKSLISPNTKLMAVIKADAYGHGILGVGSFLKDKVDFFAVANIDEALKIREGNIKTPILIFSVVHPEFTYTAAKKNISLTICRAKDAFAIGKELKTTNCTARVHLKIDTGMGRLGEWYSGALKIVEQIADIKHVYLEGIYSHLACAEDNMVVTKTQIDRFSALLDALESRGLKPPICHISNSAGILKFPQANFNMVRPGIALYGFHCCKNNKNWNLYPAMKWVTYPMFIKEVPSGTGISYGHTFITRRKSKIAVLPIGYFDGYNRLFSNKAEVIVHGKRCPVIGRVCMNEIMVDVSEIQHIDKRTQIILLGSQCENSIGADDLARIANTIPYEILCNVHPDIKRAYYEGTQFRS